MLESNRIPSFGTALTIAALLISGCITDSIPNSGTQDTADLEPILDHQSRIMQSPITPEVSQPKLNNLASWSAAYQVAGNETWSVQVNGIEYPSLQNHSTLTIPYLLSNQSYQIELRSNGTIVYSNQFRTPPFSHYESVGLSNSEVGRVRPGDFLYEIKGEAIICTPTFMLSDARGSLFFLTAAHCAPSGTVLGVRQPDWTMVPIGEVILSGIPINGTDPQRFQDIGLIEIFPEAYDLVLPTMVGDRGPSRPPRDAFTGETLCQFGQGGIYLLPDGVVAELERQTGAPDLSPETRYRCGDIGGAKLEPFGPGVDRGEFQTTILSWNGDSGSPNILLDGSPVGYPISMVSLAIPQGGDTVAVSICHALEQLWEVGYEVGVVLGESVPELSPFYTPAVEVNPRVVDCDEEAPYMTVPYKSWQIREGLLPNIDDP